jgi:hypothetical protein
MSRVRLFRLFHDVRLFAGSPLDLAMLVSERAEFDQFLSSRQAGSAWLHSPSFSFLHAVAWVGTWALLSPRLKYWQRASIGAPIAGDKWIILGKFSVMRAVDAKDTTSIESSLEPCPPAIRHHAAEVAATSRSPTVVAARSSS